MQNKPFKKYYHNKQNNAKNNNYINYHNKESSSHNHTSCPCPHDHSLIKELWCHLPTTIFSLVIIYFFSFVLYYLFSFLTPLTEEIFHNLFHISHYIHIMCALTGSLLLLERFFNHRNVFAIMVSIVNTIIFCTISDITLPSIYARLFSSSFPAHICFFHMDDMMNIAIFIILGLIAAYALFNGDKQKKIKAIYLLHSGHIIFGCLSALLYILSHNIVPSADNSGIIIILLLLSVVVPCVISGIVIPYFLNKFFIVRNNVYNNTMTN